MNVLVNSFATHGDTQPNVLNLSRRMLLVHVSVNCSSVIFNLSKTLGQPRTHTTRTTLFWSETGWTNDDANNCPTGGNTPVAHECCGGNVKPYFWINTNKQQCCNDSPIS